MESTVPTFNPFAAEVIFVQCSKKQIIMKIIRTKSCGYSYESSRWVLSDEYPFARVSVIFQLFLYYFILTKLATSTIRVNFCTKCVEYTTVCSISTHFPWLGCKDDLVTERSFDSQATCIIDLLRLFSWHLSVAFHTTRHWQTTGRLVQKLNVCTVESNSWSLAEKAAHTMH